MKHKKTVCIDLDGVLAEYDGWKGPEQEEAIQAGRQCSLGCTSNKKMLRKIDRTEYLMCDKEDRMKAAIQRIRLKKIALKKERSKLVRPMPPPRYDMVYFEGLKWIDSL